MFVHAPKTFRKEDSSVQRVPTGREGFAPGLAVFCHQY